jgi:hypothetical protein
VYNASETAVITAGVTEPGQLETGYYNSTEYLWALNFIGDATHDNWVIRKLNLSNLTLNTTGGCAGQTFGRGDSNISAVWDMGITGDYIVAAGGSPNVIESGGKRDAVIWVFKMNGDDTCTASTSSGAWRWTGGTQNHAFSESSFSGNEYFYAVIPTGSTSTYQNSFYAFGSYASSAGVGDLFGKMFWAP